MSWSVSLIGKPAKVVEALNAHAEKLTGQCKTEFDAALPHLVGLVAENFAKEGSNHSLPTIKLEASGSGGASGGDQISRSLKASIDSLYHTLV